MSRHLRHLIFTQVTKSLQNENNESMKNIVPALSLHFENNEYNFKLPIKTETYDISQKVHDIILNHPQNVFHSVDAQGQFLSYKISRNNYTKFILDKNSSGVESPVLMGSNKNILVEFSSPNIAKPFHLGHFRSTMIGNCISNINSFLGHNVKKINYLGDWGKQFGLIHIGTGLIKSAEDDMKNDPITTLYQAYVAANKQLETDPKIEDQAQEVFRQLELEDTEVFKRWELYKKYTVSELSKTYERLGVQFDEYHWESMYRASQIQDILSILKNMQLTSIDEHGRTVIHVDNSVVPLVRSDNTTLYILRDIAAAIDRYKTNLFDVMYYVVDGTQTKHFNNISNILRKMEMPWVDKIQHVGFGRIVGMSTRKGTSIFMNDILNELQTIMREGQEKSLTTKVSMDEMDTTADILGVTGLIMYDLQQRRERNYNFQLEDVINIAKSGAGRKLQYTHCRLFSLENEKVATPIQECDPSCLQEAEIDKLLLLIGKFDEIVLRSYSTSQPCVLAGYTIRLCTTLGSLFGTLVVKNQPTDVANNRLLLFHVGRLLLAQCMRLLGITPLNRM